MKNEQIQQAVQFHQAGQLQQAEVLYRQILEDDPDHVDANHYLGVLAQQVGRNDAAIELIQKAIKVDPDLAEAHCNLGISLKQMGRLKRAATCYRKAISIKPHYAEAHYNLGIALRSLGQLGEAEVSYLKALEFNPDNAETHNNLGMVLQELGRIDEAIACFRKATVLNPENNSARGNLALTLKDPSLLKVADEFFKIVSRQPENSKANHKLGQILSELERYEEAIACFQKAIFCSKDKIGVHQIHLDLALAFNKQGRLEECIDSLKQVLAIKPDNPDAHFNIGVSLMELGRVKEAEASIRKALAHKSDNPNYHFQLALAVKEQGRAEEAVKITRNGMDRIPIKKKNTTNNGATHTLENAVALMPFGRSGSLFFHSLMDGHPEISTLPGAYFKGFFGQNVWKILNSNAKSSGYNGLVDEFCEHYQVLFDARANRRVFGDPFGQFCTPGQGSGLKEMGENRDQWLSLNKDKFKANLIALLKEQVDLDNKVFFQLIHRAYDQTLGRKGNKKVLFYHIHNPTFYEATHFLKLFPQAKFMLIVREPVQALESWVRMFFLECMETPDAVPRQNRGDNNKVLGGYRGMADRVWDVFDKFPSPLFELRTTKAIRLEDIKRSPRDAMPAIARWMGVKEHESLYTSSFQDLAYWGPPSKRTPNLRGFDTANLDSHPGDVFSEKDRWKFRTLLHPLRVHLGYGEADNTAFQKDLKEVGRSIDEPLDFERNVYEKLSGVAQPLEKLGSYRKIHAALKTQYWNLQRGWVYSGKVEWFRI